MSDNNQNVREPIIKLGQMITDRIGHKVTAEDPEYWGLAAVITDEMAEIGLKMKVRHPRTMADMVSLTGRTEEELKPLLDQMSEYGMLEFNWENKEHVKQWVLPMFVPGAAEFFMMHPTLAEEKPQLADFFERMTFLPLAKITAMVPPGGSGVGMHVIPVEKAIDATQQSASVEHISHWLNKYDVYSVGACSCRKQQRIRNEGTGDLEGEYCIGVGDMAHYCVETNKGRYCTYDEVIEILNRAERHGYVHQITNIDGENKIFAICNCAPGVCNALRTSQLFNTPNMSASAYRAHVDKEKCVACGKCVEICPVGAVKLGQKLCSKHGEVAYPKALLPDATKWGDDKWDRNYRNNAKINCYDTGTAPCKTSCPAHLAVQGYIKMASEGKYMEALKLIKQDNPFPAVCGAICNRRCEDVCTRGTIDQPLAIDEIKKFIAQQELDSDKRYIPLCENGEGKFYDEKIAVIGAG
ncbi:MAG: pyridine nucleotide-disulfide oxidoreductase, partial [Erysipelotrichia bacterium]|nr:pyridine nucleotide-disulfide oxidoreductase [Erysipelotrichia bacterium]